MKTPKLGNLIVGIDEAGRGPLAGPVIAAAVVLDPENQIPGLTDSKKLSPQRRTTLCQIIQDNAIAIGVGRAEVDEIDELNILQASLLAMKRAVDDMGIRPDHAQVDGNQCPILDCTVEAIVKGDSIIPAISAASIIAKVFRDQEMLALDKEYPTYHFSTNKGYPTATHIEALREFGASPVHRRSFRPVARYLKD